MSITLSRRDFLSGSTALTGLALLGATGGCQSILQQIQNRPVRRAIHTLADNSFTVQTYKAAVAAMKALPSSDPRSWSRQAQIHDDHCPHENWYFLPWHRAYLFYFESICRELTGETSFALPYWNWQVQREVPSIFWGGAGNPLFHTPRTATPDSQAPDSIVGPDVIEDILEEENFQLFGSGQSSGQRDRIFYGSLEATPHNLIHGFVGGTMSTFLSPLDPVFWCHHNMVECVWVRWNITRGHPNPDDPAWTQFTFEQNFFDANGDALDITVGGTLLMPYLSYRFGPSQKGQDAPLDLTARTRAEHRRLRTFLEEGAPVSFDFRRRLAVQEDLKVTVRDPVQRSFEISRDNLSAEGIHRDGNRLLLNLEGVEAPEREDIFVQVFLGPPAASAQGSLEDPGYAGSFGFFADPDGHGGHHQGSRFVVDITKTVERLRAAGNLAAEDALQVRLVAEPFPDREVSGLSVNIRKLELATGDARVGRTSLRDV